jgi:hypothetical protein
VLYERLPIPARVDLHRRVAEAPAHAREAGERAVLRREGEYWTVAYGGSVVRLRDTKGLRHLARLLTDPAREVLAVELARAVGLGGRDRRAASHAERARLNSTRAIRAAMANLARAHPSLGEHLSSTIRTGRYCSYTPDPRAPIRWEG